MYTGYKDSEGTDIKIGDILSLNGDRVFKSTGAGEVIKYKGDIVCFYGQYALGRDCFDKLHTVNKNREVIGHIDNWEFEYEEDDFMY